MYRNIRFIQRLAIFNFLCIDFCFAIIELICGNCLCLCTCDDIDGKMFCAEVCIFCTGNICNLIGITVFYMIYGSIFAIYICILDIYLNCVFRLDFVSIRSDNRNIICLVTYKFFSFTFYGFGNCIFYELRSYYSDIHRGAFRQSTFRSIHRNLSAIGSCGYQFLCRHADFLLCFIHDALLRLCWIFICWRLSVCDLLLLLLLFLLRNIAIIRGCFFLGGSGLGGLAFYCRCFFRIYNLCIGCFFFFIVNIQCSVFFNVFQLICICIALDTCFDLMFVGFDFIYGVAVFGFDLEVEGLAFFDFFHIFAVFKGNVHFACITDPCTDGAAVFARLFDGDVVGLLFIFFLCGFLCFLILLGSFCRSYSFFCFGLLVGFLSILCSCRFFYFLLVSFGCFFSLFLLIGFGCFLCLFLFFGFGCFLCFLLLFCFCFGLGFLCLFGSLVVLGLDLDFLFFLFFFLLSLGLLLCLCGCSGFRSLAICCAQIGQVRESATCYDHCDRE